MALVPGTSTPLLMMEFPLAIPPFPLHHPPCKFVFPNPYDELPSRNNLLTIAYRFTTRFVLCVLHQWTRRGMTLETDGLGPGVACGTQGSLTMNNHTMGPTTTHQTWGGCQAMIFPLQMTWISLVLPSLILLPMRRTLNPPLPWGRRLPACQLHPH